MARRYRTITEQLGSILIAFEVVVVFLVALTLFGLKVLSPVMAFVGGAGFLLLLVLGVRFLRYPWGRWYVLVLQVALLLCGFFESSAFVVGGIFLAVWVFCMVRGGRIDAERAPIIAEYERSLTEGD